MATHAEVALPTRSVRRRDDEVDTLKTWRQARIHGPGEIPPSRFGVLRTMAAPALDGGEEVLVPEVELFSFTVLVLVRNDVFERLDATARSIS